MAEKYADPEAMMWRIRSAANAALTASGKVLADQMVRMLGRDKGAPSVPDAPPNTQTGELSRSLGYSEAKNLRSVVGSGVFYAKVLEFGKVIRAKKKALLIPLTRVGQNFMRDNRGGHFALLAYQYRYGKAVVRLKTASGILIGRRVGGKNQRYEIDFMLTARVQIKERPFMRPAVARAKADMRQAFRTTMRQEMGLT